MLMSDGGEKMELEPGQLDQLRTGALTAIDGLWFMAVEKKLGFEQALELDLEVWNGYGLIMLKRLLRMLNIKLDEEEPPDLATVSFLLETLCRVDGTECSWEIIGENTSLFRVHRCSWWDNLCRAGRENLVPCEMIDNTIFANWLKAVDPSIALEITSSFPRGDQFCTWILRRAVNSAG